MTKRSVLTREEVLQNILDDSDQDEELWDLERELSGQADFDDTMCPMAAGSDDEFLDLDEEQNDMFSNRDSQPQPSVPNPENSTQSLLPKSHQNLEIPEYVQSIQTT